MAHLPYTALQLQSLWYNRVRIGRPCNANETELLPAMIVSTNYREVRKWKKLEWSSADYRLQIYRASSPVSSGICHPKDDIWPC
jgi:hypothetical protein